MERVWTLLVSFFSGKHEIYNLKAGPLIIVITGLLIALLISIIVARKNNLYSRSGSLDESLSDVDRIQ